MWNAYENYRPDKGPLATYFNYTIRNRMIDLLRQKTRMHHADKVVFYEEKQKMDTGNKSKRETVSYIHGDSDIYVTDIYFWKQVKSQLTDNQWKWVYYYIVECMSIKEIAKREHVSVDAVKSWGRQARKKLRYIDFSSATDCKSKNTSEK